MEVSQLLEPLFALIVFLAHILLLALAHVLAVLLALGACKELTLVRIAMQAHSQLSLMRHHHQCARLVCLEASHKWVLTSAQAVLTAHIQRLELWSA